MPAPDAGDGRLTPAISSRRHPAHAYGKVAPIWLTLRPADLHLKKLKVAEEKSLGKQYYDK